jgi:hypothetical protein
MFMDMKHQNLQVQLTLLGFPKLMEAMARKTAEDDRAERRDVDHETLGASGQGDKDKDKEKQSFGGDQGDSDHGNPDDHGDEDGDDNPDDQGDEDGDGDDNAKKRGEEKERQSAGGGQGDKNSDKDSEEIKDGTGSDEKMTQQRQTRRKRYVPKDRSGKEDYSPPRKKIKRSALYSTPRRASSRLAKLQREKEGTTAGNEDENDSSIPIDNERAIFRGFDYVMEAATDNWPVCYIPPPKDTPFDGVLDRLRVLDGIFSEEIEYVDTVLAQAVEDEERAAKKENRLPSIVGIQGGRYEIFLQEERSTFMLKLFAAR